MKVFAHKNTGMVLHSMPRTFPFKSFLVHYQSSNHPKPGLVNVFEGACPNSLQIGKKPFLLAQGNSEQHNKVLKPFINIIHCCIIIINTYYNYINNAKYNYYIFNKCLLEECGKGENMAVTAAATTFCLNKKTVKRSVQCHVFAHSPPDRRPNDKYPVNTSHRSDLCNSVSLQCYWVKGNGIAIYRPGQVQRVLGG
jgi:hypothetical protein